MMKLWIAGACVSLTLLGCDKTDPITGEGADAGDCVDEVDNDNDGFVDCFDNGCGDSPDCAGFWSTDDSEGGGSRDSDEDPDSWDNTDPGPGIPDTALDTVGWGCDENAYWFDIYTVGVSTGGWLYTYQTGSSTPWNEDHPIDVLDTAGDSSWTRLYLSLDSVWPDFSAVVSGSTTLYDCTPSTDMWSTLTFVVEIDDADGNIGIECAVWGNNPDAAPADDCARITPDTVTQLR